MQARFGPRARLRQPTARGGDWNVAQVHRDRRSMRAAGERQQHHRAGKIETNATLHARENANSFFNVASTLTLWEFVKEKDSLPSPF
jgi:hypothetical protein